MIGALDGKVAIVTGAGSGLGRAHAERLAGEGAAVVVNDVDPAAAAATVAAIAERSGQAIAFPGDVADWATGEAMTAQAVETFGDLHVLVNNAGNLRQRTIASMSEAEWDDVIRVHLKGHFVMLRWAARYWRERHKAGDTVRASVINTTSTSGLMGQTMQASYAAAKAGIAALTTVAAEEMRRFGVRVNAVAPVARTAMVNSVPELAPLFAAPAEGFDPFDPANVSAVVAYLASDRCVLSGQTCLVFGGRVHRWVPWTLGDMVKRDEQWTIDELADTLPALLTTEYVVPSTTLE